LPIFKQALKPQFQIERRAAHPASVSFITRRLTPPATAVFLPLKIFLRFKGKMCKNPLKSPRKYGTIKIIKGTLPKGALETLLVYADQELDGSLA